MLPIPLVDSSAASPEVAAVYADFRDKMGFRATPNFIQVQGASLAAVQGTCSLVRQVLVQGVLPRALKEMTFVAISVDRGCRYCEAAHLNFCRMLAGDARTLEKLVSNIDEVLPEAAREVLRFAVKCARAPQGLSPEDFASLKRHGFSEEEVTELIALSALAVYANTIADATGVPTDDMFGQY